VHGTVQLSSHHELWLVVCSGEKNDLAITTTNDNLVSSHSSDGLDALSASVDVESKRLIFNLEGKQITAIRTGKQVIFSVFAESHAGVVSHDSAGIDQVVVGLAGHWVQLPQSHLALSSNGELIVSGVSSLVIFGVATPGQALWRLTERRWNDSQRANNMSIRSVPNKEFSIENVSAGE